MNPSPNVSPGLRVLHLEDCEPDAELTAAMLMREWPDCHIERVDLLDTFLAAINGSEFDLILSDYSVPGFSGLAALDLAHKLKPDTPYLFLSGTIGEDNAVDALKRGATDYIIKDRPGRLIPAIKRALEDVRERRRRRETEEVLRESQERLLQLAEQSSDAFWFVSLDPERVLYVSPAYAVIWGQPISTLNTDSRAWEQAVHVGDRERVRAAYEACRTGQSPRFEEEFRVVRPAGSERQVLASGIAICDPQGRRVRLSLVVKDITERKIAEQQALRAQRLDSLGLLAGGIAHDLNNVLAPILMAIQLLRLELSGGDSDRLLQVMEQSSQHGAALLRQVLAFARGADGERTSLQTRAVVGDLVKLLAETLPRSISIQTTLAPDLAPIQSNATQFGQVLMNLCVNARDAMPEGGTLAISGQNVVVSDVREHIGHGAKAGTYVRLAVRDTGSGMPPEVIDRIFDPFFTTKAASGKGTGLGLSTVLGIVQSHGGFLEVESKLGVGSEFRLYFPGASSPKPHRIVGSAPEVRGGKGETILVVDDEESIRVVAEAVLGASGYNVISATNGRQALELYRSRSREIAVVLVDMIMPGMQGQDLIRELHLINPQVLVIAMSGMPEKNWTEKYPRPIFLAKPMSQIEILRAVQTTLANRG